MSDETEEVEEPYDVLDELRFSRHVLPNVLLLSLAGDCYSLAKTGEDKQQYWSVATISFAALAVEAAINLVGHAKIKRWEEVERTTSPSGKLVVLENALGFEIDRSSQPFNSFSKLFRFRNQIVHAKSELLPIVFVREPPAGQVPVASAMTPYTEWEKLANLIDAERLLRDATQINEVLAQKACIDLPVDGHDRTLIYRLQKTGRKAPPK